MSTLGERLAEALKKRDRDAPALIAALGRSKGLVYNILNDITQPEKVQPATVKAICRFLRINEDWFLWDRGDMEALPTRTSVEASDWRDVLAHRVAASMGPGAMPDEYAETQKLKFRADSLRRKRLRPDKLGVVYGKGDSMLPRIKDGDAILFDASDTQPLKDGALYVISYDDYLYAKALTLLGGRWFMESLNRDSKDYRKPQPIEDFRHFKVHGRVRWIGSWED